MTPLAYVEGRDPEVWRALLRGFDASPAAPRAPLDASRPAILGGLQGRTPALLHVARLRGAPYVFVDNGYFATHAELGGRARRIRYRVVPDAYAHHWPNARRADLARFEALGVSVAPWRKSGRHILVCLSSPVHAAFFGLRDWPERVQAELARHTDRPIRVRAKNAARPLAQDLADCWAVVAWSSKAAVDAVLCGVPAFVGPESPALPIAEADLARIEAPPRRDRREWLAALAWGQFTLAEIASGMATELCAEWSAEKPKSPVAA